MSTADELRQRAVRSSTAKQNQRGERNTEEGKEPDGAEKLDVMEARKLASSRGNVGAETLPEFQGGPLEEEKQQEDEMLMTEEQIEEFFEETIAKLSSPEERENIKSNVTDEVRIPALLIKIQHEQLTKMGIDKEVGQAGLNQYARTVALRDKAARAKMERFTSKCQQTYIEVLREMEPADPETEAKMVPRQIMEFFEACDTLMALPETKQALRDEFLETKVAPDKTIVEHQRKILRTLGFDPDHGVACITSFAKDYPNDEELKRRLQQFMHCASMARREAMLGKEGVAKMMQQQQAQAMRTRKMAMALQALDEKEIKELLEKAKPLTERHAEALASLPTNEERVAYVKEVPESEQWTMDMARMYNMATQKGRDGCRSSCCASGEPCSEPGKLGDGHVLAHPSAPLGGAAAHRSHSEDDKKHISHEHSH